MNTLEQTAAAADIMEDSTATPVTTGFDSGTPAERAGRLKRWGLVILFVFAIAFVAALLPRLRHRDTLQSETRELAIPAVTVISPSPADAVAALALPAEVRALSEAAIYARANGYLKKWHADLGAHVDAGQLLAEIDTPEINQDLAHSRAELTQAEAALELSRTTAARWAELLKSSSVSEQEAAEKKADLALKSATVEAARSNVKRLEEMQSFGRVSAPFAGVITARRADVGDLIVAGAAREIFHLADLRTLRVFVHVPDNLAAGITVGETAELLLGENQTRTYPAKVVRTAGVINPDSRTLLAELEVDNARGEIYAGSFAQVRFPNGKSQAALTLPSNCLIFRADGPQVGVVQADGKVEVRRITLGRDFGPHFEVVSGVTATDQVILNPADSLISGAEVRILK